MFSNENLNLYKPKIGDLVYIKYSVNIQDHLNIDHIKPNSSLEYSYNNSHKPIDLKNLIKNEITYNFIIGSGIATSFIEDQICKMNVGQSVIIVSLIKI